MITITLRDNTQINGYQIRVQEPRLIVDTDKRGGFIMVKLSSVKSIESARPVVFSN